jgi:dTDP-4-dehydrorhamnose reductase
VSSGPALITGGGGQLSSEFQELLGADARSYTHAELDIADADAVTRAFAETEPALVLNCAAFHNVDVCETEQERAWQVNVRAVRELAGLCAQHGAKLVHLSTNYVFDGTSAAPYAEQDLPNPRSIYAITKLAGEQVARAYSPGALVVRGAGLYGLYGSRSKGGNFVQRMAARAREQGALRMVADQRLSPTFTADLARAILDAVEHGAQGVVHLTSAGACSWLEFTEAIMEIAGIDVPIEAVATTVPAGGADRPLNGVLANHAAERLGLRPLRPWREGLEDYMSRAGLAAQPS